MRLFIPALFIILLQASCRQIKVKDFDVKSFPAEWVQLTETDSGFIIYNSCDQGNLLMSITNEKNMIGLFMHGMQEDYFLQILGAVQSNDTIRIKAKWPDSGEEEVLKFVWIDKAKGVGEIISSSENGNSSEVILVTQDKQKYFPIVNQPCRECWGDECDEIEKQQDSIVKGDSIQ